MIVKICGITTYEDALTAAESGADMLGFNFYKKSPRYLTPESAALICDRLRTERGDRCPLLIGLFVNELVAMISVITRQAGLDAAQLHGDESEALLKELRGIGFKAIRPQDKAQALDDAAYFKTTMPTNDRLPSLLLDAYHPKLYGGTGEQASTEVALAVKAVAPRLMLAGGLTPENIAGRIAAIQPWGVDVSSGVELPDQPGKKDAAKVKAFIAAAQGA
jgi:phosphoribosylanthranilate isomerase